MPRLICTLLLSATLLTIPSVSADERPDEPVDIGSRRELFVDDWVVATKDGAEQRLHRPVPREVAITYDAPNEGNISYYVRVFRDGDVFRMYYRGAHYDWDAGKTTHQLVCYAESRDAIHWTKPELGLFEFEGSKQNNIVWNGPGNHNFAPFRDANPDCKPEELYKALGSHGRGLIAFSSPDGIHWKTMSDKPVITRGAFDSQNLAFWDAHRGQYVDFHRGFTNRIRAIMTCTSPNFLDWTEPQFIDIPDSPPQHLYTNATVAYHRAPHIFLAFPKRFVPSRPPAWHPNPEQNHPGVSDGVLMTSRDGQTWKRWDEAFLRPGRNRERWWQRNNHIAWGLLETPSDLPGHDPELSLYSIENYYVGPCRLRRYTLRLDGFVSMNAPFTGGEFTTRLLKFDPAANDNGTVNLEINYATSAAGSVRCELLDEAGEPIPGFALQDCDEIYGDELARVVTWKGAGDVSKIAGKPVRLRVALKDADLYSFRFNNESSEE